MQCLSKWFFFLILHQKKKKNKLFLPHPNYRYKVKSLNYSVFFFFTSDILMLWHVFVQQVAAQSHTLPVCASKPQFSGLCTG